MDSNSSNGHTAPTPDFSDLPFVEKKAMLDFAENQREAFVQALKEAVEQKDTHKVEGLQKQYNRWIGYINAITAECEQHIQRAVKEGFDPLQHVR